MASGLTTEKIMNDLIDTRVDQFKAAVKQIGLKRTAVSDAADYMRAGMRQMLLDLRNMDIVEVVKD